MNGARYASRAASTSRGRDPVNSCRALKCISSATKSLCYNSISGFSWISRRGDSTYIGNHEIPDSRCTVKVGEIVALQFPSCLRDQVSPKIEESRVSVNATPVGADVMLS